MRLAPAVLCLAFAASSAAAAPSLEKKAGHFERIIRERHVANGFIRELNLKVPGKPEKGGTLHHSDNDGLWTSLYVAAMSFKYAATGEPGAKAWARHSLSALQSLESVTGIPGFPARSIVKAGDPARFRYDGEWHKDASGRWEWKGDTSSDELDGHFLAYAVYYDLAADDSDKEGIRRTVGRIMDHIVNHDWYLVDLDGRPTRWGVWNPKQLNENRELHGAAGEDWRPERALNSLEILSHLKVAYHVTGSLKYQQKYLELIDRHGYADNLKGGVIDLVKNSRSDIQLAFLSYYPLLRYEKDPRLLKVYKESLEKTWAVVKAERNPLWDFIHCAYAQEGCDPEAALKTLRELPEEQINWMRNNRGQPGVRLDPRLEEDGRPRSLDVLPYDRITIQRWNGDPYLLVSGGHGDIEGDGVLFLLPYWLGRYHGLVR